MLTGAINRILFCGNYSFNITNFFLKKTMTERLGTPINHELAPEQVKNRIWWRIRNIGQSELEYILMKWFKENSTTMGNEDLSSFADEILNLENPELLEYLINFSSPPENLKYTKKVQESLMRVQDNKNIL